MCPKWHHRCPCKRKEEEEEKKAVWRWRQRLEQCNHRTRIASDHQKPEEARHRLSSRTSREGRALLTPWFQSRDTDFRFLASRTVREYNLCCLSHQVCYLVRTALGNKYRCIYNSLASTLLPFPCPLPSSHTGLPAVLGAGTLNWFPPQGLSLVTSSPWDALIFAKRC